MKTRIAALLATCVFSISLLNAQPATITPAPPHPVDQAIINELVGTWVNDLKSELKITSIDPRTGAITGTYISYSGTDGTEFPLQGWVNSLAPNSDNDFQTVVISWSVRWGRIGSITAWNGIYAALPKNPEAQQVPVPTIVGNWLLSRPGGDFEWDHVLAGQDRFKKKPNP